MLIKKSLNCKIRLSIAMVFFYRQGKHIEVSKVLQ